MATRDNPMFSDAFKNFLSWEDTTKDTIDFKKAYVDMAGDIIAGLMLCQIIYWYLPSKRRTSKLQVVKDGMLWLAKAHKDWWDEIRLTVDQARRALQILVEKGLVATEIYKFNGAPTTHMRILPERFLEEWNRVLAQMDLGFVPNLGNGLEPNSITETTIENNKEPVSLELPQPDYLDTLLNNQEPQTHRELILEAISAKIQTPIPDDPRLYDKWEKGLDSLIGECRGISGKKRLDDELTKDITSAIRAAKSEKSGYPFETADQPNTGVVARIIKAYRDREWETALDPFKGVREL